MITTKRTTPMADETERKDDCKKISQDSKIDPADIPDVPPPPVRGMGDLLHMILP
jgi:hypothetical protein